MTPKQETAMQQALEALIANRRKHYYCEDTWYSCPRHEEGCANDAAGDECNCGADQANIEIDKATIALQEALAEPAQEPVTHFAIADALFDFMGWLTSRSERIVLSCVDDAAPAVKAITEFAKMRGLSLDEATLAEPVQEAVSWGVDWGGRGDQPCVSILKKHPNGVIEVVAVEYGPPQRKPLTSHKDRPDQNATFVEGYGYVHTAAVRAVEAAHGITGENT